MFTKGQTVIGLGSHCKYTVDNPEPDSRLHISLIDSSGRYVNDRADCFVAAPERITVGKIVFEKTEIRSPKRGDYILIGEGQRLRVESYANYDFKVTHYQILVPVEIID